MSVKNQPFSNIFLFTGEDQFSLNRKISKWKTEFAKKYGDQAITVIEASDLAEGDIIKNLQTHFVPSLFASKKLVIIRDGLPSKAAQTSLADFLLWSVDQIPKDFFVVFWQTRKLDGRLAFSKKFAGKVMVNEFSLPEGMMLNQWIKAMTKILNANITDKAADRLAQFLGRDLFEDKKPVYNLWEIHSELLKLSSAYDHIDIAQIESLVKPKIPDSVFELTDQVIAKNQKGTMQALENFLSNQTIDEKTQFIKIVALLAEQFRSLLLVSLLTKQGLDNDQIAKKLGWSSGRVFVTSKNLRHITIEKLQKLLSKLLLIDQRIKSTDTNQKLDLNLFLARASS